jgi:hypothetical protein
MEADEYIHSLAPRFFFVLISPHFLSLSSSSTVYDSHATLLRLMVGPPPIPSITISSHPQLLALWVWFYFNYWVIGVCLGLVIFASGVAKV